MADAREPEAESTSILKVVRVSRRGFLNLSMAVIVGLSLFWATGCGGGQDGGEEGGDEEENGGGGGNGNGNGEDDGGGY